MACRPGLEGNRMKKEIYLGNSALKFGIFSMFYRSIFYVFFSIFDNN